MIFFLFSRYLYFITKSSIWNVAAVLDPPLKNYKLTIIGFQQIVVEKNIPHDHIY